LENVSAESATDVGIYIQNVGGLQGCPGCETAGSARGVVIAPEDNETVDGVLWNGAFIDGSDTVGLEIAPTGSPGCNPYTHPTNLPLCGRVTTLQFANVRPSFTQNGPGVAIDSTGGGTINGVMFANLNASLNSEEGVKILGSNTKQIHFVNSQTSYNNTSNTGKSGVYVGTGVSRVTFNGGCSSTCSTQHPATVNRQVYGLEFATGASSYRAQGMDLSDNTGGPVQNDTTNTDFTLLNNSSQGESYLGSRLRVIDGTTEDYSLMIDGSANTNGGASIRLYGDGVSTPGKTLRVHSGKLEVVNNAFNAVILDLSDAGLLTTNNITVGTGAVTARTVNGTAAGNLNLNAVSGQSIVQQVNGANVVQTLATTFQPTSNNATLLGQAGNRWSNVNSVLGNFSGVLTIGSSIVGTEISPPAAPAANGGVLYFDDNGAGKTRLMVRFATGAAQQVAIEP
jgi:hypothetical protein